MLETFQSTGSSWLGAAWPVTWTLIKIVAVLMPLLLCVAYLTLWERKAIGWSQIRPGPNRVGPFGLLQPIADAVKLIFKEIIVPTAANKGLFFLGPIMTIMPALAAWAVVPFGPNAAVSEIVAGHMVEYSGMSFAMFFLAEYANIILVSVLASVMFLGGWQAPISFALFGYEAAGWVKDTMWFWNWFWLFAKTFMIATLFL